MSITSFMTVGNLYPFCTLNRAISTVFVGVVGIGVIIGLNMC